MIDGIKDHLKTLAEYPPVQGGTSFDMSNVVQEIPATFEAIVRRQEAASVNRLKTKILRLHGSSPLWHLETCRPLPPMSVHRERPEVTGALSNRRD